MTERVRRWLFFYTSIGASIIFILFATVSRSALYADGSHSLMVVLTTKNFAYLDAARDFTVILNDLFCLMGIYLGIKDIAILSSLFSFGYGFTCMLPWIIAAIYSHKIKRVDYLLYTAILQSLTICYSGFFMQIESVCALGTFWCLFMYYFNYQDDTATFPQHLFFSLLGVFSTRLHHSFLFLGLLLIAILIYRLYIKAVQINFFIVFSIIMQVIAAGIAALGVINPRSAENARQAAVSGISFSAERILFLGLLTAAFVFIVLASSSTITIPPNAILYCGLILSAVFFTGHPPLYFFDSIIHWRHLFYIFMLLLLSVVANITIPRIYQNKRLIQITSVVMESLLGLVFLIHIILHLDDMAVNSYNNRTFNIMLVFGICCILFFLNHSKISIPSNRIQICASAFLIAAIIMSIYPKVQYNSYLKEMNHLTESETGFVNLGDTALEKNPYHWWWTTPSESVASQAIYGKNNVISCIAVQDPAWIVPEVEPYNSANIYEYPDLQYYGITYDYGSFQ